MVYRKNRSFINLPEDPSNLGYDFIEDDDNERTKKFNFMTTVSIPVYDKRENAVSKNDFNESFPKFKKIKNLRGIENLHQHLNEILTYFQL